VKLDDNDRSFIMAPQSYLFWAVSAPVTILILITWIMWLQRTEIANYLERRRNLAEQKAHENKESSNNHMM